MNKLSSVKSVSSVRSVRGAAMVEYALLLCAILLIAAAAFKTLGHKTTNAVHEAKTALG